MATTFELISSVTVGAGGAASIDFTSIPSTYTDLCVKISARTSSVAISENILIRPNGLTTNLSSRRLAGTGSSAASYNSGSTLYAFEAVGNGATSSTFNNGEIYIPNYAGGANKSFSADGVMENNNTTAYMTMTAGLWSSTSVITSLTLVGENGGSFLQYSTAYLYGVKNA